MGQIMSLAKSLGGESSNAENSSSESSSSSEPETSADDSTFSFDGADPKTMHLILQLMQEYGKGNDENIALLNALRPFLRKERAVKIDQAIQIAKLSRVARLAFQMMKGGEGPV